MKRSVQRRAHQLGHSGVEDRELPAVGKSLDVHDAGDERAGMADDRASGLEHDGHADAAQLGQHGGRVFARRKHRLPLVSDTQTAAEIDVFQGESVLAQFPRQRHQGACGAERADRRS